MKFEIFVTGPIDVNTYLVYDELSKEAIAIDVGGSAGEIWDKVQELNLNLKGIYNTHGHFDHILGAKELQELANCPFFVNSEDNFLVENLSAQMAFYGMGDAEPPMISGSVNESSKISIGDTVVKVIETPGHTPGGVCYLIDGVLFSGDTLFYASIGRTDLPGGDYQTLKASIREKLFTLADEITVYPGHDCSTSIGHEKQYNMMV